MVVGKILIKGGELEIVKFMGQTASHDLFGHADVVKAVIARKIRIVRVKFQGKENAEYHNKH